MLRRISVHPGVAHLGVAQPDGLGIGQYGGVNLVLGSHNDVHARECGAHRRAEGSEIVPLVRPEVQIEDDGRAGLSGDFRRIQGGAPARLPAQIRAGKLEHATLRDRRGKHVIDRKGDIGAVVPVENQRKFVRRLDAQYSSASFSARFPGTETDIHPFLGQKMDDEVTNGVLSEGGQVAPILTPAGGTDAHVGGGAAHVGGKTLDMDKVLAPTSLL